jgi:hypothetical protein
MLVLVLPFEVAFFVADLLHLFLVVLLHLSTTLLHIVLLLVVESQVIAQEHLILDGLLFIDGYGGNGGFMKM